MTRLSVRITSRFRLKLRVETRLSVRITSRFRLKIRVKTRLSVRIMSRTRLELTLSYTGFFWPLLYGGRHKVPAAFFSETVKATAIKLGTLTN